MGALTLEVGSLAEFAEALQTARAADRTTVIVTKVRASDWTEGGAFWQVGVPEVADAAAGDGSPGGHGRGTAGAARAESDPPHLTARGSVGGVQGGVRPPQVPVRCTTSMAPVCELRRNSRSSRPETSLALATVPSGSRTFEPAVTYRPASTTQLSPRLRPTPAFAPMRLPSPMLICSLPPPDSVPMIEAPPPMSEPSPTTTPAEMRPSTIEVPSVPALKLTNPSCMTTVPGREVGAQPDAVGVGDPDARRHDVVDHAGEAVDPVHGQVLALAPQVEARLGDAVDGDGADVRPRHDRQDAEDAVEVDAFAAGRAGATAGAGAGRRRRCRRAGPAGRR